MRRREFIALIGGAVIAWPLAARPQQAAMPVIGFLNGASADSYPHLIAAFRQGLSENGFVEGRNVVIEYRWADNKLDRLPALAADLMSRRPTVIATGGLTAALAAKEATNAIPIVFSTGTDPVETGIVASLNRPGGNVTGVTSLTSELVPKQLEVLRELLPAATIIAALIDPTTRGAETSTWTRNLQAVTRTLGLQLHVLHASSESDFDAAFETLLKLRAAGLVMQSNPFFTSRIGRLATLTVRHALPAIYGYREFAAAGGLLSYGSSFTNAYRLVGAYAGRILKGEKPADLPVQQAAKIEMVINMKTARALGLTVPLSLRGRADEVIE